MRSHTFFIEGVGFWAPSLPGWPQASAAFRGEAAPWHPPASIPRPVCLPSAERRRASETVALALIVAQAALEASGRLPDEVLAVFTSAHGDLPAIDHLCSTLAQDPMMVSPSRFLHTVHNAPMGVWSILTGNTRPHTAVSAADCSFAAGLLEAAMLAETEQQPVLLVGYDTAAKGALVHTNANRGAMAAALVLHPQASAHAQIAVDWHFQVAADSEFSVPRTEAARRLPPNGMLQALPLLEALARGEATDVSLPLSGNQRLQMALRT
jgi:hypothetical protein